MDCMNCTSNEGAYYNHTCYYEGDMDPTTFNVYKNISDSTDCKSVNVNRTSPADEYFQ